MKHLSGHFLRWPAQWLPLLGAAYSRARESTCDRHGLACSGSPEGAARSLAALSAGAERWQDLDIKAYRQQAEHSAGFWMSFHELTAGYPWLTKRVARVMDTDAKMPRRSGLAWLFAAVIPYAGRLGGGFGLLIMVYIIGILAAIAIPEYQNYTVKAKVSAAMAASQGARDALANHYQKTEEIPASLEAVGVPAQLADGTALSIDSDNMVLTVKMAQGELVYTPRVNDKGQVTWTCSGGEGFRPKQLPKSCQGGGGE